jgi:hypothetical protein
MLLQYRHHAGVPSVEAVQARLQTATVVGLRAGLDF